MKLPFWPKTARSGRIWLCCWMVFAAHGHWAHRAGAAEIPAGFTYDGNLTHGGQPVNSPQDFRFVLFADQLAGPAVAGPLERSGVAVSAGRFSVPLDFGPSAFGSEGRWLEIAVRPANQPGAEYVRLAPRQPVMAVPYALYAITGAPGPEGPPGPKGDPGAPGSTWAGISGIPAGFADGIDNNTVYSAGPGLELGVTPSGSFDYRVKFAGDGFAQSAARSDHTHDNDIWYFGGPGEGSQVRFGLEGSIISARQTATAASTYGINAVAQGEATGVLGASTSGRGVAGQSNSGAGVHGTSTSGTGVLGSNGFKRGSLGTEEAAVVADAGSSTATAIQVEKGALRVKGAGLNSNTFVFVHAVTVENYADFSGAAERTFIDHPLCNNDPNAILLVTPRYPTSGAAARISVYYHDGSGFWRIYADPMDPGDRFNVMVIKP